MLDELRVANLGLIGEAHLEPGPGLVVVTGETGAGKTLLVDGIRLLLGVPAKTDHIGPFADEATVEGRFVIGGEELVVSRRVVRSGRSRAYLDGGLAPLRALAERIGPLVELVAQHEHLSVDRPGEARAVLDRSHPDVAADYRKAWQELDALTRLQSELGGDRRALEREHDLLSFQVEEIEQARFEPGEDQLLRDRARRLRHADELMAGLAAVGELLDGEAGVDDRLGAALSRLRELARLDPSLQAAAGTAEDLAAGMAELRRDVRSAMETVEHDPQGLADVESRLAVLGDLVRKYGADLSEVAAFADDARRRREELRELLSRADRLDGDLAGARDAVLAAGARLAELRRSAAAELVEGTLAHLRDLGFPHPMVRLQVTEADPGPGGADDVRLLFASDAALEPSSLTRASGGELSRLVLALRLAGGSGREPVVVFDEVDAGIGGITALTVGRKLAALAERRQVLCVTHLPQVAAFADRHVVVARDGNRAVVDVVDGTQRLEELARMLSGLPESSRGRHHAEELLALAGDGRA